MESQTMPQYNTLFATDQDCIAYLFQKRWPDGFHCPFCDRHQKEIAPAHTVVCRYCRKQSSITAGTLMHGSKKNLSEWMQVAAQFCFSKDGMSARSLQNSPHIATYQTAWNWLKKLRKAAAIAESAPLKGPVQLTLFTAKKNASSYQNTSQIACLMEITEGGIQGRIRLVTLPANTPDKLPEFITQVVPKDSIIITTADRQSLISINEDYHLQRTDTDNAHAIELISELQGWMQNIYRGATDPKYLQDYLDEFCFRHNTANWNNSLAILDHLLTGIMGGNPIQPLSIQPLAIQPTPAEDK